MTWFDIVMLFIEVYQAGYDQALADLELEEAILNEYDEGGH